jgi:polyisoprenoid-binding protein YceI
MSTLTAEKIPGYVVGTWNIDPVHSEIGFTVRHLMVSKVRGKFTKFEGTIVTAPDPLQSKVEAKIDLNSIDTGNEQRDNDLRSSNYFEVDKYPEMIYRSTSIRQEGDGFIVEGDLTLHGVTRQVPLRVELNGFTKDPWGGTRVGFSATTEISRKDFGISFDIPLEGGGVVVGDRVQVNLEIEAVLAES